jgi:hypothetical protein
MKSILRSCDGVPLGSRSSLKITARLWGSVMIVRESNVRSSAPVKEIAEKQGKYFRLVFAHLAPYTFRSAKVLGTMDIHAVTRKRHYERAFQDRMDRCYMEPAQGLYEDQSRL